MMSSLLSQRAVSFVLAFGVISLPYALHGATDTGFKNPLGDITLYGFLVKVLNAVIFILFPIIVLMIVYTGFLFIAAQGNPSDIAKARQALLWTVVGALILLGSKALAMAICGTVKSINAESVGDAC